MSQTFLETRNLKKYFKTAKGFLHAVDDVNLTIDKGETLGLVGESGCGKSTLGRVIIRLLEATEGQVLFNGEDIITLDKKELRGFRRRAQMVFQDPYSSLNPRLSVTNLIAEPDASEQAVTEAVNDTLNRPLNFPLTPPATEL